MFLVIHWDVYRIPVDFKIVRRKSDPKYQKENELFRQRWFFVMACARTWKFANGQALRNLVNHLPL